MNKVFSCINATNKTHYTRVSYSFSDLVNHIKYNKHKDKILFLHSLDKNSDKKLYESTKLSLPAIKPHAIFKKQCLKENFHSHSGFLYLDIDNGINDVESFLKLFINKHKEHIALAGKSVGGKGIFFYIRLANTDQLTADNFCAVQDWVIQNYFTNYTIDTDAKGINRTQVIPYDENVYVNESSVPVTIEYNEIKSITGSNKRTAPCNTTYDTFLDISEVNNHIIWTTQFDIGDELYQTGEFKVGKLFLPRIIPDGTKHQTFRSMTNVIMYNYQVKHNEHIGLHILLSFFNYINQYYTGSYKMYKIEMIRTITEEYTRIINGGEFNSLLNKHVITNSAIDKKDKHKIGCEAFGEYRKNNSINKIKEAVELLILNGRKPTQKEVGIIVSFPFFRTIQKYKVHSF